MSLQIIREDITDIKVNAIVCPSDHRYSGSGGTDKRIHRKAGKELDECCRKLPYLKTGEAVLTQGFRLENTDYIIHTSGPVWKGGKYGERELLENCYRNVLKIASEKGFETLAIPLISTGTFRYPLKEAFKVATAVINDFLLDHDLDVFLLVYNKKAFELSNKLFKDVRDLLVVAEEEEEYEEIAEEIFFANAHPVSFERSASASHLGKFIGEEKTRPEKKKTFEELDIRAFEPDESFKDYLRRIIFEKGLTEYQVYKASNLTKQAFNKIYNEGSIPKKINVLALAIGMKLNVEETRKLSEMAGYSFGRGLVDRVVAFAMECGEYDIFKINAYLLSCDQPALGSRYQD